MRQYVTGPHNEEKLVLKLDYKNAVNTLRRDVMLKKVQSESRVHVHVNENNGSFD